MASSARAASPCKTRKARTVGAVQASTIFVINGNDDDTLNIHRAQRLVRDFGLTDRRARVVAGLCWEGPNHG